MVMLLVLMVLRDKVIRGGLVDPPRDEEAQAIMVFKTWFFSKQG